MSAMAVKRASAVAAALLAVACAEVLDLDRFQAGDSATGSGSGSSSGTSDGTCVCTPEPKAGWSGPGVLYLDGGEVPLCPDSWPTEALVGGTNPSAAPASCLPCTCAAATGVCGGTTIMRYGTTGCVGTSTIFGTNATCGTTSTATTVSLRANLPLKQMNGSCEPLGGGVQSATPPSFEQNALLCEGATPTASCGAGSLCVPRPAAPFTPQVCIWRAGDVACESPYVDRTLIHSDIMDGRSCAACNCGPPQEITIQCAGHVELYHDGMCAQPVGTTPADGQTCTDVGSIGSTIYVNESESGSCPVLGGDPIGDVTPANPTTICCHSM